MSILLSKCESRVKGFSKDLYTEVVHNLCIKPKDEWTNNPEDYKSVLFAVYARTDRDNLVLTHEGKFAFISYIPELVLSGGIYPTIANDSGLLCGKDLLDSAFNVKNEKALYRLVGNSTCYPIGAVETSNSFVLVFNVVLSVDLLTDSEISLNSGFHFVPIETFKVTDELQKTISESLVLVRK